MNQEKGRNHKIRLLHLVHGLGMGGAEIALFHYIKALGMEGYDHYVYCFGGDGPARERIESAGIPVMMGKKESQHQTTHQIRNQPNISLARLIDPN